MGLPSFGETPNVEYFGRESFKLSEHMRFAWGSEWKNYRDVELITGVSFRDGIYHQPPGGVGRKWMYAMPYKRSVLRLEYEPGIRVDETSFYVFREEVLSRNGLHGLGIPGQFADGRVLPDPNALGRAMTEALNKLGDGKVAIAQNLAEVKQTANMLADLTSRFANAVIAARMRQWQRLRSALGLSKSELSEMISGSWLKYQFGWRPLMSEIYGAHELLTEKAGTKRLLLNAKRTVSTHYEVNASNAPALASEFNFIGDQAISRDTRCVYWAEITSEFLRQSNRMGLINPELLAWELIPFSFLVDWVLPVGNTLRALSDTSGVAFVDGYVSHRSEMDLLLETKGAFGPGGKPPRVRVKAFGYQRGDKLTGFHLPEFYVKRSPMSTSHIETCLALLAQLSR